MLNLTGLKIYAISLSICIGLCTNALANDIDKANIIIEKHVPNAQSMHKDKPNQKKNLKNLKSISLRLDCYNRIKYNSSTRKHFGEVASWWGVSQDGYVIEVLQNPKTRTWSAILTLKDGKNTCIVAGGPASVGSIK